MKRLCDNCMNEYDYIKNTVKFCSDTCRFFSKINITKSCWIWTGISDINPPYGRIKIKGKLVLVHRFMYEYIYGIIPNGLKVYHTCDNVKCVNPNHLFLGTQTDNMRDCAKKGRIVSNKPRHRLSMADKIYIERMNNSISTKKMAKNIGVHWTTILKYIKRARISTGSKS